MTAPLTLPILQNWSCHNCGGCCRQHLIEVTDAERARIEAQQWTAADGLPAGQPLFEWHAGPFWKKRYRLAHRSDGACVFLDDRGYCRIHGKFGEVAKPLACRIYPYAFHPRGKTVTVSLRYSCPSVVANRGQPLAQQMSDLRTIAEAVVPAGVARIPAPAVSRQQPGDWPLIELLIEQLDGMLAATKTPWLVRIFQSLAWVNLLAAADLMPLPPAQRREYLHLVRAAVMTEFARLPEPIEPPSSLGRLSFRLVTANYARKDTVADLSQGWAGRWRLLRAIWRFSRGRGDAPPLQAGFQPIPFAQIDQPMGGPPEGTDELFTRYLRVKLQGLHFCGRAYYDVPFIEGWQSLVLVLPVVLWLAKWHALSLGREQWTLDDVQAALAVADHHHGFSPVFGQASARSRLRTLAESGDLSRLCVWAAK